jgi:hypothetical protein
VHRAARVKSQPAVGRSSRQDGVVTADERATTLYRFFDARGQLLYVGITERKALRFEEHRRSKGWWTKVDSITTQHFATRDEAAAAELAAIRSESPLHNIVGVTTTVTPTAVLEPPATWTYTCFHCGVPIDRADEGYIWTDPWDGPREGYGQWWIVTHVRCDPFVDTTGYWWGLERLNTLGDVLDAAAHVGSKTWCTDDGMWFEDAALGSLDGGKTAGAVIDRYSAYRARRLLKPK